MNIWSSSGCLQQHTNKRFRRYLSLLLSCTANHALRRRRGSDRKKLNATARRFGASISAAGPLYLPVLLLFMLIHSLQLRCICGANYCMLRQLPRAGKSSIDFFFKFGTSKATVAPPTTYLGPCCCSFAASADSSGALKLFVFL